MPTCKWFVACDHEAVGVIIHPVLGPVPICDRCAFVVGRSDDVQPIPED